MAKKRAKKNQSGGKTDPVLTVLQDLFILEGLQAGMKLNDIRKILRIAKWRIANISKVLPELNRNKEVHRK